MNYRSALDIILQEFYKICEIPHPSHHEEQIGAYLFQWAKDHGLAVTKDRLGDIIIEKPAAPGMRGIPSRHPSGAHGHDLCGSRGRLV